MRFGKKTANKSSNAQHSLFTRIFIVAAVLVFGAMIAQDQVNISKRKTEIILLEQKIQAQKDANAKMENMIAASDDAEYIEKVAREKYGYVMAGERVFVNTK